MTTPLETVDWLAIRFRDDADTSPGESHLEQDAVEVEAVRDSFKTMLAALKALERVTSQLHPTAESTGENLGRALLNARAAIADAEGSNPQ